MLAEFQYKVHFRTDYIERDIVQGKKNEKRGANKKEKKKKIKHFKITAVAEEHDIPLLILDGC
jgi:hypothetical protein